MSENPNNRKWRRGPSAGGSTWTARPDAVAELLAELPSVDLTETAALRELLFTAIAPAAVGELGGEDAALAAFRAARLQPAVQDRRRPNMMHNLARLLTVKAAAIAVAVTATGGVALAAGTGTLPVPGTGPVTGSATVTPPSTAPTTSGHVGSGSGSTVGASDWTGLCRAATQGHALNNPGKADQSAAFSRLITAAGGLTQLPAFCSGVLGSTAAVSASPTTGSTTPTAAPSPTGAPGNGLHLGWCKGVGNPHNTAANCGTTGTNSSASANPSTGTVPPGWCKGVGNPHNTAANCGTTGTSTSADATGNGTGNANGD
jgi:hypothetical protein